MARSLPSADSAATARRAIAHLERGASLAARGDPWAAAAHFRALVQADPADPVARKNLAAVLLEQAPLAGDAQRREAREHLRAAVRLAPTWADARYSLGLVLQQQGDHQAAMTQYQAALSLDPEHACAHASYTSLTQQICDWAHLDALWERARHWLQGPDRAAPYALTPLSVVALPSTAAEQREAARRWVAASLTLPRAVSHAQPDDQPAEGCEGSGRLSASLSLSRGRPLRVGYLSADLRAHPVAHQIVEVLERHDRARVRVTAYSLGPDDGSALRARIAGACDAFVDLSTLPAPAAARRIADDDVDVLVDLNGWTQGCRPEILALRPAAVQVNYLGYPGTMAAPFIDYVITDRYLTPPAQQRHWSERFCSLPDCYMPSDSGRGAVPRATDGPSGADVGLPATGVVFCCFNNTAKITPAAFDVWMRLLQETPGSVLWLTATHPCAPTQLRREAAARGVDAERLIFAEHRSHAEYLALFGLADLFLDTWPYNGGATVNDALWAGLPVLTLAGATYVSRMAASQLRAVGLPDLVATSAAQYARTALAIAHSPLTRATLRERLSLNRRTWPLFDTGRYVRHLEDAYVRMAARAHGGAGPPPRAVQRSRSRSPESTSVAKDKDQWPTKYRSS